MLFEIVKKKSVYWSVSIDMLLENVVSVGVGGGKSVGVIFYWWS